MKSGDIGKLHVEMFDEELIALNEEIPNHPALMMILEQQEQRDIYILICEVAAYCQIVLAGDYSKDDVLKLCTVLTEKLQSMRSIIIQPDPKTPIQ